MTSITIPDTVTSIGSEAFYGCSSLKSIVIPDSVTSIGSEAFYGCSGLTSVTISNSVTKISNFAFEGCKGLTAVYISDISVWCNIDFTTYYSNPLLYAHNLYLNGELVTDLVLPDSITKIKDYTFFRGSCLTSVTIPNSVTSIGNSAFFACSSLISVTIPDSVTSIGSWAFSDCSGFTSVTIPDSVTSIGKSAFDGCTGLTKVTIPNSVIEIGNFAFSDCTGLTSVTIPNSVTSIGYCAFSGCKGLTAVYISALSAWCNIDFNDDSANPLIYAHNLYLDGVLVTDLVIPDSISKIKDYTFDGGCYLTSVIIPNTVTSIGKSAFEGCKGLTSITIPKSVTSIGGSAFNGCTGITSLVIENLVKLIDKKIFKDFTNLKFLTFGDLVDEIPDEMFSDFTKLESIVIGNSVTTIGSSAFSGCTSLTYLIIPNSVTEIGSSAFSGCTRLTSLEIGDSVSKIDSTMFNGCTNLISVSIGESVSEIGESTFHGCHSLKYIEYGAKNATIGENTKLSKIEHIVFGENVEAVPTGLFDDGTNTITIVSKNTNPPVCDENAFTNIDKTKCILYVPTASIVDYWTTDVWKDFSKIRPFNNEATSVSLDDRTIATCEMVQLNATTTPEDASIKEMLWFSSNPKIATISASGELYRVAPGKVTITAMTVDGSKLLTSCQVKVIVVKAESINLSQTAVTLEPNESLTLTCTILPQNTSNKKVTWTSSVPSIATVIANDDASASVIMQQPGTAVIKATTTDGSNLSASCIVSQKSGVDAIATDACSIAVENGAIVVKNGVGTVMVYNTMGVAVTSVEADGNELRIDGLQQGVYIVTLGDKAVKVMI